MRNLQPDARPDLEPVPADARLDRLLGDRDLLLRLQLSGYSGVEWDRVASEFCRYGLGVLEPWTGTGKVFARVAARTGYRLAAPPDGALDDDAANEIASEVVVRALHSFLEDVLKKNRWDPSGGASLKTFFIGKCLWEFPNVYKQWWRRTRRWAAVVLDGDATTIERRAGIAPAPDEAMIRAEAARDVLAAVTKESARAAFALQDMGYSLDEVAAELGLADSKTVENLLGYQRRRAQGARERKAQ